MAMSVHTITIDTLDVAGLSAWWAEQAASPVRPGATNLFAWSTLADPEGNEFCVSGPHPS